MSEFFEVLFYRSGWRMPCGEDWAADVPGATPRPHAPLPVVIELEHVFSQRNRLVSL